MTNTSKTDAVGIIAAFEQAYPELYWHVAKGKITAGEPLYGAMITTIMGAEIGHGESDISADDAFRIAIETATQRLSVVLTKTPPERPEVDDEAQILQRLADGDTIVFSMDGDMAWFTRGDRAFVGDAIMSLREKGYLLRKHDVVDDADDPRGIAYYDTISESGRSHLLQTSDSTN